MMKKLKAFTLVELMVIIAMIGIFSIFVISMVYISKFRTNTQKGKPAIEFKVGDFVYFYTTPITTVTGMVDNISREGLGFPLIAALNIQGTNGMPYKYGVNVDLLHKVPETAENYK